ncbi:MAG: DUF5615 family PIN-like protein [Desmonostoc geniculatum HA4340-LM1]|jgi:hypothetical protein|nr:DUF5615 family PIN-like protein [Desmonostoc geniculatum HA4340-LM1]
MTQKIRFHLDENVSNAIAEGLRRRGIDVTTTLEAGLIGASDREQLHFALSQNRVIFTHDSEQESQLNAKSAVRNRVCTKLYPPTWVKILQRFSSYLNHNPR